MQNITPSERALAGSFGAHLSWANTIDRSARTAPARAKVEQGFLDQADGDPVRAAHLRTAYYKALALKSARARRKSRELEAEADTADAELRELTAAIGGAS